MKKKIKDLTKEEREAICKKSDCRECPLAIEYMNWEGCTTTECFADRLEKEVEVPEEELE